MYLASYPYFARVPLVALPNNWFTCFKQSPTHPRLLEHHPCTPHTSSSSLYIINIILGNEKQGVHMYTSNS
jgi:hypothetical protein